MIDFSKFSQSDWVELIGIMRSLFVGIISLIIAIKTLKQNSNMIEESTRPYIVIYPKVTYVNTTDFYIVLKNMGQCGAIMKSVKCDINLSTYVFLKHINPFDKIANTFFAPNQSIFFELDKMKLQSNNIDCINFEIQYATSRKTYKENFSINCAFENSIVHTRVITENKELKNICYALQEMIE